MQRLRILFLNNFLLKQITIASIYCLLVFFSLHYFPFRKFVTVPDLAAGFAVSALILLGPQYILGILVGAVFASILSDASNILIFSYTAGAALQALVGFYFVQIYKRNNESAQYLNSLKDYFVIIASVGFVSTLIRPLCVSLALLFSEYFPSDFFFLRFSTLWLGDALGCVLIMPLFLLIFDHQWSLPSWRKIIQAFILCSVCFMAGQVIFFDWLIVELGNIARPYWMFLFISWIAIVLRTKVTSFVLLLTAIQSFWSANIGVGSFAEDIILTGLMNYSFFIFIACFLGMSLALYANEQVAYKNALLLKLSELQLKEQALDSISQGVLISDEKGSYTYTNRAFQEITGYAKDDLIGKSYSILQGPDSDQDTIQKIKNFLNNQLPFQVEILNYRRDGSTFWNDLSISPVKNSQGELTQYVGIHQDITHRKLAESQAKLASIVFDHNPNAITVTDAKNKILLVNKKFIEITGYEESDVVGKNPGILASGKQDKAFYADMWKDINTKRQWEGEIWNCRKDGEYYPEWLQINVVVNDHDEVSNYIGMFTDLSQHKKAEADIQRLENFDVLTGLPNLVFMQNQGDHALKNAQTNQSSLAVLYIDLDHFKSINDSLGHHIGDLLIIEASNRFKNLLREGDTLSRQGGDEFVVLLPGASKKGAAHVAKKILDAATESFQIEEHTLNIATSIGVALYPQDGLNFEDLSRCADTALFHAKEHGRNNVQFYASKMSSQVVERVHLENALHLAVIHEQFDLHYQALVDLQSGKITGFEALIRWTHPELGPISPVRFIPVAEACGLINIIGVWVTNRACQDIRRWMDLGLIVPQIAINFSPRQFLDPNLITNIQDALDKYQLPTSALCMEITEGVLMKDVHASQVSLLALKQCGITLSLDDFGTGYSSLSYLKLFPFDKVKIDQSFVREITSNNQDAAIVIAIIGMAHSLGLKVLAEGVETEAQCDFLRNNMADEIQGYFFSKPISSDAAEVLIRDDQQLPSHLLRLSRPEKTLLLVDDEQNIVSSLKRLLRRDGYHILTANSGQEGLDILAASEVDVIISDQRMPGMTGVEFLRNVKELYPATIRMVLSGYTELTSVTDAINEGAVFRFLTKPWDDEKLRDYIKEAFRYKELADDNRQLSLKVQTSNQELATANRQLANVVQQKQQQIARDTLSLDIAREALQHTPVAVIGLDDANVIAFANDAAMVLFSYVGSILGEELGLILPALDAVITNAEGEEDILLKINENHYDIRWRRMGEFSQSSGKILILTKVDLI